MRVISTAVVFSLQSLHWGLKYIFVTYSTAGLLTSVANGNSMGNVTDETIKGIRTAGSTSAPTRNSTFNRSLYWPQAVTEAHKYISNSLCPSNTLSSFSIQIVQRGFSFFGPAQEITMFYVLRVITLSARVLLGRIERSHYEQF